VGSEMCIRDRNRGFSIDTISDICYIVSGGRYEE
jgi:hypothetical protein